ncbi:hypothetical protein P152DRAFT_130841 [Eremomyces bilateralis CBS 781.70]|uniref:Mediator complex subunit 15 KIX domain-containing protein n=1 Tax=Eremomyces bilateralis CBS 781.70 TaxID=1392243 RepID=A0A6G1GFK3_9PEZI|nr:uncharacterized protein P152DRAFT_130841 [Eremomyces bilateralis CBS 781.70]KAF1816630.1 hypothetical protein P152DRAFT_130841 [Eremomyces bilateralis CBS 781.70]
MNAMNTGIKGHLLAHYQRQQSTQPVGTWQQQLPVAERVGRASELYTSLKLAKNPQNAQQEMQVMQHAVGIESQFCQKSPDKQTYIAELTRRLTMLAQERARNTPALTNPQNPMANMQRPMMGTPMQQTMSNPGANPVQNQGPPPFQPQLQRPMQASPIPPNPVSNPTGMTGMPEDSGLTAPAMQQQGSQAPNQPRQTPGGPQAGGQQMMQNPQIRLTQEDVPKIQLLAQRLFQQSNPQFHQRIREEAGRLPPDKLAQLQQSGQDPVILHFRKQAQRIVLQQKQQQSALGQGNNPPGATAGGIPPNMSNQRSFQGMNPQDAQGGMSGQQEFDFSQIAGQQADALRSQDAGQLVVPASNNMNPQHQLGQFMGMQNQMRQPGMGGPGQVPNDLAQQQAMMNMQQNQPEHIRQQNAAKIAQAQAQAQAHAQARLKMAQNQGQMQQQLRGQSNGLNAQTPQQNSDISLLTQPMDTPGQQSVASHRPQSAIPPVNAFHPGMDPRAAQAILQAQQRAASAQGVPNGQGAVPRQLPPWLSRAGLSQAQLENLAHLPPPAYNQALQVIQDRVRHLARPGANMLGNQVPANQNVLQMGQLGDQFMGPQPQPPAQPPHTNQGMPNMMGQPQQQGRPPSPKVFDQQNFPPQGMQGPQGPPNQQQVRQNLPPVNPEMLRQSDGWEFPQQLVAQAQLVGVIPENVKTWGQLKEWVARNPQAATQVNPEYLLRIQTIQVARRQVSLQQQRQAMMNQRNVQGPNQMQSLGMGQPQMQGMNPQAAQAALQAQQRAASANVQQMGMGGHMQRPMGPNQIPPNLPPVTPQEIQQFRQRFSHAQNVSDDMIRKRILGARIQNYREQQLQNAVLRQQGQPGAHGPGGIGPQAQGIPQQPAQLNKAQGGQVPTPAQPPKQGQKPSPAQTSRTQAQPAQQGTKRPNDDGAPAQAKAPTPSQGGQRAQAQTGHPANISPEQMKKLNPQQQREQLLKAQAMNQEHAAKVASQAQQASGDSGQAVAQRFMALYREMEQQTPRRPANPVDLPTRNVMQARVNQVKPILAQFDKMLHAVYSQSKMDEKQVRSLMAMKVMLLQNMSKEFVIHSNVNLSTQELEHILRKMGQFVQMVMMQMKKAKEQQTSLQQGQPPPPPKPEAVPPPAKGQPATGAAGAAPTPQTQLSADNLKMHQAELHKARRSSKPPPAPTTTVAPGFPVNSPQGVPKYATTAPEPPNLNLPPKKKQRYNTGTSSAQGTPGSASSPQVGKGASPDMKRQPSTDAVKPVEPAKPFKCNAPDCEHGAEGFATEHELEDHRRDVHHPPITDPLQFAIDSVRNCLGLDERGERKAKAEKAKAATKAGGEAKTKTGKAGKPVKSDAGKSDEDELDSWSDAQISQSQIRELFGDIDSMSSSAAFLSSDAVHGGQENIDASATIWSLREPNRTPSPSSGEDAKDTPGSKESAEAKEKEKAAGGKDGSDRKKDADEQAGRRKDSDISEGDNLTLLMSWTDLAALDYDDPMAGALGMGGDFAGLSAPNGADATLMDDAVRVTDVDMGFLDIDFGQTQVVNGPFGRPVDEKVDVMDWEQMFAEVDMETFR